MADEIIDDEVPQIPQPVSTEKASWWQRVVGFFVDAYEWLETLLADPETVKMLRADLGLPPADIDLDNADISLSELQNLRAYAEGTDVSAEAFAATLEQLSALFSAGLSIAELLDDDATNDDAKWEVFRKILAIYATQSVRARDPLAHSIFKMAGVFIEQFGHVERLDIDRVGDVFADRSYSIWDWNGFDSYRATQFSDLTTLVVQQILVNVAGLLPGWVDSYYGWDTPPDQMFREVPDPEDPTGPPILVRRGDTSALERMWTFFLRSDPDDLNSAGVLITFALVPEEHGGPGVMMSLGGQIALSRVIRDNVLTMSTTSTGAFGAFIGFTDEARDSELGAAFGDLNQSVEISWAPKPPPADQPADTPPKPAILLGGSDGIRLEVSRIGIGGEMGSDLLAAQLDLLDAKVVVPRGANALLDQLIRDDVTFEFDVGLRVDNRNGVHLTNGSGFQTNIPLNRRVAGVTFQYVDIGFQAPENQGQALELFATTAVSLDLGPFHALIERFGYRERVSWGDTDRDFDAGFQPPKGIAISVDADPLKGGGYLFIDPDNDEYRGAFELTFNKFSIKAIGILTTEVPGHPDDWAFIALITVEFPPWGPVSGIGGLIGIHHGLSIDKLQNGIREGVLDSILFPKNPIANPTKVINHVRAVFPLTPGALTIGVMVKLTFGGGSLQVLLGLIVQFDNAIGNDDTDASLSRLSVIGRIQITVPALAAKPKLSITLDIAGSYDFAGKLLSVDGRLRDSKIGAFSITGSGSVRRQGAVAEAPGIEKRLPSQVITIGGWNPRFTDIPPGIPKQDRFGFSLKSAKGAKTKYEAAILAYFADTPNTRQIGVGGKLKVQRWGFTLDAWLSFDGIWYSNPDYYEVDIKLGATVKRGSKTLMAVDIKVYLRDPSPRIIRGSAKLKFLFFSKTIQFCDESGEELSRSTDTIMIEDLLAEAIRDRRNWDSELPGRSEMLVTLRDSGSSGEFLAHPLGQIALTQQVVPLGIRIDRLGEFVPGGASRFDITDVQIGDQPGDTSTLTSYFSRSEYLDLTSEEKLASPSFERMNAGCRVDLVGPAIPTQRVSVDPGFELKYRGRPATPTRVFGGYEMLASRATMGAAARSRVGRNRFGNGPSTDPVVVADVRHVVATTDTLEQVDDAPTGSYTAAAQATVGRRHQVVEAQELVQQP